MGPNNFELKFLQTGDSSGVHEFQFFYMQRRLAEPPLAKYLFSYSQEHFRDDSFSFVRSFLFVIN